MGTVTNERMTAVQLRGLQLAHEALRLQAGRHASWCDLIAGPKFADTTHLPFTWECSCGVAPYQAILAGLVPAEAR